MTRITHWISEEPIRIRDISVEFSAVEMISAGYDERGHEFTANMGTHYPGLRIMAGCRYFGLDEARRHWSRKGGYVLSAMCWSSRHQPHFGVARFRWWLYAWPRWWEIKQRLVDINRAIDALEAEAIHRGWIKTSA